MSGCSDNSFCRNSNQTLALCRLLSEFKNQTKELLAEISGDLNTRFKLIEKIAGQNKSETAKVDGRRFLSNLSVLLRDALLLKNMCFNSLTHSWLKQPLSSLTAKYSSAHLASLLNRIKISEELINRNINLRLTLENLMLEF